VRALGRKPCFRSRGLSHFLRLEIGSLRPLSGWLGR